MSVDLMRLSTMARLLRAAIWLAIGVPCLGCSSIDGLALVRRVWERCGAAPALGALPKSQRAAVHAEADEVFERLDLDGAVGIDAGGPPVALTLDALGRLQTIRPLRAREEHRQLLLDAGLVTDAGLGLDAVPLEDVFEFDVRHRASWTRPAALAALGVEEGDADRALDALRCSHVLLADRTPLDGHPPALLDPRAPGARDAVLGLLRDAQSSKERLLVHCADGHRLTGVVLADWLLTDYIGGDNYEEACHLLQNRKRLAGVERIADPAIVEQWVVEGHI